MADNADRANDLVLERLDRTLAARVPAQPGRVLEECEECGDPIPFERVQALAKMECLRCVECQGYHERRVRG
ncbi:TraR/DksA C4-type zinc finger protein [Stutzerimonas nitrititolerans]|uniref:TraR/DksA C4-type zinc finger protein n=1 Tax=Stutzerimonas nitrititolerans TaxID=2482751 RepID=UPI00289B275B|nr:TraR/DksA C4-type zinc finger protein [Stutzerimonas nitrititolerans]